MVSLNTMVLNVLDNTLITLQIINVYHARPTSGHDLHNILRHEPDDTVPTTLVSDFNTHSPLWSLQAVPLLAGLPLSRIGWEPRASNVKIHRVY